MASLGEAAARARRNRVRPIPLDHPAVVEALAQIPAEYHARTWIAGSAACRFPEAWDKGGDLDMWICDLTQEELLVLCGRDPAARHLDIDPRTGQPYVLNSFMYLVRDRLHVLATAQSIEQVVLDFDIACHAAAVPAVEDEREMFVHPVYTRWSATILNTKNPTVTLERAIRFSVRYWDSLGELFYDPMARECAKSAFRWVEMEVGDGL